MKTIDQFLYGNYICWKTDVLVFMWLIKLSSFVDPSLHSFWYNEKIARVDGANTPVFQQI